MINLKGLTEKKERVGTIVEAIVKPVNKNKTVIRFSNNYLDLYS